MTSEENKEENKLDRIEEMLEDVQNNVNDIQSDVRMNTTINKELNKPELKSQILSKLSGEQKKRIWLVAEDLATNEDLSEAADVPKGTVTRYTREMAEAGVLKKRDDGNNLRYARSEVTEGIGLEQKIIDHLDSN